MVTEPILAVLLAGALVLMVILLRAWYVTERDRIRAEQKAYDEKIAALIRNARYGEGKRK